jgi:hypothetical protein
MTADNYDYWVTSSSGIDFDQVTVGDDSYYISSSGFIASDEIIDDDIIDPPIIVDDDDDADLDSDADDDILFPEDDEHSLDDLQASVVAWKSSSSNSGFSSVADNNVNVNTDITAVMTNYLNQNSGLL